MKRMQIKVSYHETPMKTLEQINAVLESGGFKPVALQDCVFRFVAEERSELNNDGGDEFSMVGCCRATPKDEIRLKCPNCGKENPTDANFCEYCSTKLKTMCDCWVKHEWYDCGFEKCPGRDLFVIEWRRQVQGDV